MQTLQSNFGWIIFSTSVIIVFFYKIFSKNKDAITSKFKANQVLASDLNSSITIIKQALKNARFSKIGFDAAENRFYAESGFSMSSWSEYIEVKLVGMDNATEIKFKSICAFPLQLFDWGKNRRNYRKFERELNKSISCALKN